MLHNIFLLSGRKSAERAQRGIVSGKRFILRAPLPPRCDLLDKGCILFHQALARTLVESRNRGTLWMRFGARTSSEHALKNNKQIDGKRSYRRRGTELHDHLQKRLDQHVAHHNLLDKRHKGDVAAQFAGGALEG